MGKSVLRIKTEFECKVFLFDEDVGVAVPDKYFNLEVNRGDQDLRFVSTLTETLSFRLSYPIEEFDCDYPLFVAKRYFSIDKPYSFSRALERAQKGDFHEQVFCADQFRGDKNYYLAVYWYCRAANVKELDSGSSYHLAQCYAHGLGVKQNWGETVRWFLNSAKQKDPAPESQYEIGHCYEEGLGVERDWNEAAEWYYKAVCNHSEEAFSRLKSMANQNFPVAQYKMGELCNFGWGCVKQNENDAFNWFMAAAQNGHVEAQCEIGSRYLNGIGIGRDLKEAEAWYEIAAEKGDARAKYCLQNLRRKIGKAQKFKYISEKSHCILFFDTETTGVPKDDNVPASDTRNWPRLVQLAWILTDKEGNTLASSCSIIKPEGFPIPDDAAKVHGINTYTAMREGKPLKNVIDDFLKAAEKAQCLVGHNVAFDQKVVGAELCRLGIKDTISTAKAICTMEAGKDYCKIPGGYYGYKPPKLQELYQKLFGTTFENAHDAMADVKATRKCFFELKHQEIPELIFQEGLALLS
jgi:TPR repeat protein